jgi:hypothetical protein
MSAGQDQHAKPTRCDGDAAFSTSRDEQVGRRPSHGANRRNVSRALQGAEWRGGHAAAGGR